MKPLSTFVFTKAIEELKQLEGAHLEKVQQIGPELFRFDFGGKKELLIEIGKRLNMTSYKLTAPQKTSQVAMFLRKQLSNKKLSGITQHKGDRIAVFDFGTQKLIGEFFSHGNLILLGEDSKILFCFRPEEWKDRKIKKGETYSFPQNPVPPAKEDYSPMTKEFVEKFKTINEAIDDFFASQKQENPKLKKLHSRLEHQVAALQTFEKETKELKEKGDLILQNYEIIEKTKEGKKGKLKLSL